jgi:hypothetical protein
MGIFDKIKDAAESALEEHPDQLEAAIEKASDFADDRTGGKHHDQIEQAAAKAHDFVEEHKTPDV